MNNHHLRSIILKLQDRLSDNDRKRLHFFLANDVPRRIRDDPTLSGTLNLMESLFDQDKINEQDFTFLIDAFKEIQCVDAVKLLRDHKKRMQSSWLNQPTLTSVIPSLNEIIEDQEDKGATQCLLNQINNYGHNNKIIDSNNTNINPVTINVDNKKIMSSRSEQNQPFYISFKTNKYCFFMVFLLVMVLGTLMVILLVKIDKTNKLNGKKKEEIILEEQRKQNKTIQSLNHLVLETNKQNAQLRKQLTELKKEKDNSLVKAGQKFGGADGIPFDDSSSSDFTCSHYLYGLLARNDGDGVESYQFLYRSPHSNHQQIPSRFHGNESFAESYEFEFGKDEKINKVEGQIVNKSIVSANGTNLTKVLITGIQFISTQDHATPSYDGPSGISFSESFDGYTLGYVTGRSDQYIEQLQFFWYRT